MGLLKTARAVTDRRCWSPPRGATHVLQWSPAVLFEDPVHRDGPGWWEIQPLEAFLSGESADGYPDEAGAAGRSEAGLRGFADAVFGEGGAMDRFSVEIVVDGREYVCPAYWLTPAGRS